MASRPAHDMPDGIGIPQDSVGMAPRIVHGFVPGSCSHLGHLPSWIKGRGKQANFVSCTSALTE